MNMNIIDKISFKEKKLIVSETLLLFSKMKKLRNKKEVFSKGAKDIVGETMASNIRGVSIVETIFSLIPTEQALILENDFIKRVNPNWYLDNWSKATYYKLKHNAINQFIYLLYA